MNKQLFIAMLGVAALIVAAGLAPGAATASRLAFQSPPPPPPPPNDNFADAIVIEGPPFTGIQDVSGAGREPDEPQNCNYSTRTVWYSFTPTTDGVFRLDMQGSSFVDTNLSLYQAGGTGWNGLSYLDCRSWPLGGGALVFFGRAGTTYYIQAGKIYPDGGGELHVNLQETAGPPNDFFAAAMLITDLPFSDVQNIAEATLEPGEPQQCNYSSRTVWYSLTPASDGLFRVNTIGSDFGDTNLTVYQAVGPGLGGLSFVGCTSWSWGGPLMFNAQAGVTYYIQAGKMYDGGGNLHVNLEYIPPPPNDDFDQATPITGLPFSEGVDTTAATLQEGEPSSSCVGGSDLTATAWYAFTPTQDGSVSASVNAEFSDRLVAAYTGDSLATLTQVGCRSPQAGGGRLTFRATPGTTYLLQVGSLFGNRGPMQFNLEVAPPPVADFSFGPWDPSVFDPVQFSNNSWDPAEVGIQDLAWDFGDGATGEGCCPNHQYAKDGDYSVQLTVTTPDGRSASTTRTVSVKTHDVAITKLTAPQAASAGQTRQIAVELNSRRYPERVEVQLFKSVPGGFQWVGSLVQFVPVRPANRTTRFNFSYTFTAEDAKVGKVTFKAVANIQHARDALPADNEAVASPTKVSR